MVLVEFAALLKWALGARRPLDRALDSGSTDSALLTALRGRVGNTSEALNQFTLISHCAEAAKSVQNVSETMPADLISTMLGYFMMRTVGPHTFGLIYSTRNHPLLSLVEGTPELGFTIIDANRKIVGAKMAGSSDLRPDRKRISTAILIVKDARDAAIFREEILQPLTSCVAAKGLDIMAVADSPELAIAVASAIPSRGQVRVVDFPFTDSGLGLSGISLRCTLST
jgi:hypothetical protein